VNKYYRMAAHPGGDGMHTKGRGRRLDDGGCPVDRDNGRGEYAEVDGVTTLDDCGDPAGRDGLERRRLRRPRITGQDKLRWVNSDDDGRGWFCRRRGCMRLI
jgi:hypothetical protein